MTPRHNMQDFSRIKLELPDCQKEWTQYSNIHLRSTSGLRNPGSRYQTGSSPKSHWFVLRHSPPLRTFLMVDCDSLPRIVSH